MLVDLPPRLVRLRDTAERVAPRPDDFARGHLRVGRVSVCFHPSLTLFAVFPLVLGPARGAAIAASILGAVATTEWLRALFVGSFAPGASFTITPIGALVRVPAELPRRVRARIALLGPMLHIAQAIVLGLAAHALVRLSLPLAFLAWLHLALAALQLLPTPPFDGAIVLEAWLDRATLRWLAVSLGSCAVIAIGSELLFGLRWLAAPLSFAGVSSFVYFLRARMLREDQAGPAAVHVDHARRARLSGDHREALRSSREALTWSRSASFREAALDETVLALVALGDLAQARKIIAEIPVEHREPYTLAALALSSGRPEEAIVLLERERARGELRGESTRLYVDALVAGGDDGSALAIAIADQRLLRHDELEDVARYADATGHDTAATIVRAILISRHEVDVLVVAESP